MQIRKIYWSFKLTSIVGTCFQSTFCSASQRKKKLRIIPQNFLDFSIAGMVPCAGFINKFVRLT